MARWNETEFIKHAQWLAEQHLVTKKSLNDLSEKFSAEHNLNPEEIRTLVRLANVATFQEMFKRKDDGDKMVEFDTGDPEVVIRKMVGAASEPAQSANIHNDKLAGELPDKMRAKRMGLKFDYLEGEEKVASVSERPVRQDLVAMNMRKLASEFSLEKIAAGAAWERKLGELATAFKRAPGYGPQFTDFEKNAWADMGFEAAPEMAFLYETLKINRPLPHSTKVAHYQERFVAEDSRELKLLKEAHAARKTYQKYTNALAWVDKNMPEMGR